MAVPSSSCRPYVEFEKKLSDAKKHNKWLNEATIPRGNETVREAKNVVFRGAFISVMVIWEAYVQDLLEDAANVVFDYCAAEPKISTATGNQIVERSIRYALPSKVDAKTVTDKAVSLGVNLIADPKYLEKLLTDYKEFILRKALRLSPVFFSPSAADMRDGNGINKQFKCLFGEDIEDLSEVIAKITPSHLFKISDKKSDAQLILNSAEAINDVLRLYYGTRCALAHGRQEPTFNVGGALYNFPDEARLENIVGNADIAANLSRLHKYVKGHGSLVWINYINLLNLQRFVNALAIGLSEAISWCIFQKYKMELWGYKPQEDN